jgi:hypothetical protein
MSPVIMSVWRVVFRVSQLVQVIENGAPLFRKRLRHWSLSLSARLSARSALSSSSRASAQGRGSRLRSRGSITIRS